MLIDDWIRSTAIAAGAMALVVPVAEAQTGTNRGNRGGGNAADVYRQAFLQFDGSRPMGLTSEEFDELIVLAASGRVRSEDADRLRVLVDKARPLLDALAPAGSMRRSDFGIDRSKGFEALMPHLSPMRSSVRLLRAQAALAIHDGDWDATLSTLRSMSSLGVHAGQDHMLISSLVGTAIAQHTMPSLDAILDEGTLTQDRAKALLEDLRGLRGSDPLSYGDAMRGEYRLMATSVAGRSGDEISDMLGGMIDGASLRGMSAREVGQAIGRARGLYEQAAAAFESDDPEVARRMLDQVEAEAERNPLLTLLLPNLRKALDSKLMTEADIEARLARLEAIAQGKKTALEMANASTWFRRAAAVASGLPDEGQEALALVLAAGSKADPLFLERAERLNLGAGRAIREALERGLACGTVDFDIPNDGDFGLSAKWLPGLRGACRVLLARAMVCEPREREELVAIATGVALALTKDPSTTRALVARSILDDALPLLRVVAAHERGTGAAGTAGAGGAGAERGDATEAGAAIPSDDERRAATVRTLRDLVASGLLGLPRGVDADRDRLATGSPWGRIVDPKRRKQLSQRSPDFALFLQVAMAPGNWFPLHTSSEVGAKGVLVRFDDILPVEATEAAVRESDRVRQLPFFQPFRSIQDGGQELSSSSAFRGINPVMMRDHGKDQADAIATIERLSEIAGAMER